MKKNPEIRIISFGLIVYYATSFAIYFYSYRNPNFNLQAASLILLFALLTIAACGLSQMKEWGRKLCVFLNWILMINLFSLYFYFPDLIPMSYVFMCIIVSLFFNQNRVKVKFVVAKKQEWQCVLVVDDDVGLLKTVKSILLNCGYSVLTAETGEEGLRIAKLRKPNLIILDVILPGIKGRDLCKTIKEDPETKDIPIVFLTAKFSTDDIKAELDAGAQAHLTKPVSAKSLIKTVEGILGSAK